MKLFLLAAFIFGLSTTCDAQAPIANIEGNASSIVSKLSKALTLNDTQQPKVQTSVTDFLKMRSTILPLADSNPKAYETKLKSLHNGFYRKLKSIMTAEQYEGFLQLQPKGNDGTNVLSQLYY